MTKGNMDLAINHNSPTIMHIDLNSCFATAEQQANPLLRGKPMAVAAYTTPNGCVISPSIEAKKLGIKVGMRVKDAKLICSSIVIRAPDPPKYRDIHLKFCKIFKEYTDDVSPKSIDEAVLDFSKNPAIVKNLLRVGAEIKNRMRKEIGEWMSGSVGIGPNRFLAKLAASLQKPDGLVLIDYTNLKEVYGKVKLVDLNGINTRFEARLNANGIFTPLEFLEASLSKLQHEVFQSICGYYWYLRLRGWEIDAVDFSRKSYGQMYSLEKQTDESQLLSQMILKLCEKSGRRLRGAGFQGYGVHLALVYRDFTFWHKGETFNSPLFATSDIFTKVMYLFNKQSEKKIVRNIAVSVFHLEKLQGEQLDIFTGSLNRKLALSKALDEVNDRYGEYIITPALMLGLDKIIIDRVAFGGVKELEDLYAESNNLLTQ